MANEHLVEAAQAVAGHAAELQEVAMEMTGLVGVAMHEMSGARLQPFAELVRQHWVGLHHLRAEPLSASVDPRDYPATAGAAHEVDTLLLLIENEVNMVVPGALIPMEVVLHLQDYAQKALYAASHLSVTAVEERPSGLGESGGH